MSPEGFDPNYGQTDWQVFIALLSKERGERALDLLNAGGFVDGIELFDPRDRFSLGLDLKTAEWLRHQLTAHSEAELNLVDSDAPHLEGERSRQARQNIVDELAEFIANAYPDE